MEITTTETINSKKLSELLRRAIMEGEFSTSEPFPSLRSLSEKYGLGLRAARTATDILVKEGLLYRRERRGTFVRFSATGHNRPSSSTPIHCVNILERITGTLPSFVRTDYFHGHTLALETHDIKMRVFSLPVDRDRLHTVFSNQYPFQEQGCILINIIDKQIFRWLNEHNVPYIVQNFTQYNKVDLPPHNSVVVNKIGGAFLATQHLIDLGHRRIGYIGFSPQDPDPLLEVYEGYCSAMRCNGLEPHSNDIIPINTEESHMAYEPALQWIKLNGQDLPTAFIARTDAAAIGVMNAAQTLGINIPRDLSIIGFNDQHEAQQTTPPLTTVGIPRTQLGRTAVELLLNIAKAPSSEPVSEVLKCQLIKRLSTAQPGK